VQNYLAATVCILTQKRRLTWLKNILKTLIMADFKKLDDKDFVFINKPRTYKEDKEFSDFLKLRKLKLERKKNKKTVKSVVSK
jgi:hypothetical protein